MSKPLRLHLFQGYGVELEYMIVDKDTLQVKPITDELIKHEMGSYVSDFENGIITWSNELVLHVVELKSTNPEANLNGLDHAFAENVRRINAILSSSNAMLMPTAAHPFMDPAKETKLWPHENNEVYDIYNKIFDCRGHGWANLQSTHLNLPFYDDEEFAKLHAAVRLILPILPALCASSPVLDGKFSGCPDIRLKYYKKNQSKLPSITGKVIPEAVFSKRNYHNVIYDKIKADIAPYDSENIMNPVWVNSRGAIPRFDRGSIEIRIMDIQECPSADLAIVSLVIETLKCLLDEKFIDFDSQMKWKTESLVSIFENTIDHAQDALIDNAAYLEIFNYPEKSAKASGLWRHIVKRMTHSGNTILENWKKEIDVILGEGCLSKRIITSLKDDYSHENLKVVYKQLADCLSQNKMFLS
jgi:carboxylate-amine ligase